MPLTEKELLARDAKRDIGAELLQSVREMKAGKGKISFRFEVPSATIFAAIAKTERVIQNRRISAKTTD